ncbi:hypothetical protein [Roseomonas fluvialis]|uniref:Uncharacterized protein n=1 Tax=Roseomonas fluvialis TaxID=1750527 RepID=A0ABN6P323_9PROT|nr:hypothetical protein [Roseomonas fluvialis]BDG72851.1 hypothetical protein Rmf_27800 [Roseomonas fluvialis]
MIGDIIAFLVATFLVGPLQSTLVGQLADGRAPAAVVQQVEACASAALPALVERASSEPWWAMRTAFGAWIGTTSPAAVLTGAAPSCGPAMAAARPFIAGS